MHFPPVHVADSSPRLTALDVVRDTHTASPTADAALLPGELSAKYEIDLGGPQSGEDSVIVVPDVPVLPDNLVTPTSDPILTT